MLQDISTLKNFFFGKHFQLKNFKVFKKNMGGLFFFWFNLWLKFLMKPVYIINNKPFCIHLILDFKIFFLIKKYLYSYFNFRFILIYDSVKMLLHFIIFFYKILSIISNI